MRRFDDWAERLEVYVRENTARTFVYGEWDCCLFVAGAVRAMTGVDLAYGFRGKYVCALGAARMMRKTVRYSYGDGGTSNGLLGEFMACVGARHLMLEVAPKLARRGDVVLARGDQGQVLGVMALDGQGVLVVGEQGLQKIPILLALRAWNA